MKVTSIQNATLTASTPLHTYHPLLLKTTTAVKTKILLSLKLMTFSHWPTRSLREKSPISWRYTRIRRRNLEESYMTRSELNCKSFRTVATKSASCAINTTMHSQLCWKAALRPFIMTTLPANVTTSTPCFSLQEPTSKLTKIDNCTCLNGEIQRSRESSTLTWQSHV
jgi:hypothetical protein